MPINVRRGEQDKLLKYILKERERRNQSHHRSTFYYPPPPPNRVYLSELAPNKKADVNIEEVRTATGGHVRPLPPRGLTFPQHDSDFSRRGQREIVKGQSNILCLDDKISNRRNQLNCHMGKCCSPISSQYACPRGDRHELPLVGA